MEASPSVSMIRKKQQTIFSPDSLKNSSYSFTMQSDFGGAEANIERIMLLANPVHTVNNANDEGALSRCKRANLKASI